MHYKAIKEKNLQIIDFVMVPMSLVQKSNKQALHSKMSGYCLSTQSVSFYYIHLRELAACC